jgi:hypothetical protein
MAVREFTDESGVKWTVWPVQVTSIHPRTAAEDFLGDYGDGWLCFESARDRRRLAMYPQDWENFDEPGLCRLLQTAAPVVAKKRTPPKPSDSAAP